MHNSQTDWARLAAMTDEEIDFSNLPEVTPAMFAKVVVKRGLKPRTKSQLTLRIDTEVIDWFKLQGRGWQTKINLLLRAYMEEDQTQRLRAQRQKEVG